MMYQDPTTGITYEVRPDGSRVPIQSPVKEGPSLQSIMPTALAAKGAASLVGGGGASSALAATEAENAAYGGNALISGATPGVFSPAGIGTPGNAILPAAGTLGAIDVLANKKHGLSGAAEGAASGAAIGSYFPGYGTVIGALAGGTLGYFGNFGDKDMYQTEGKRLAKARAAGVKIADSEAEHLTRGRSKAELVAIEQAKAQAGKPNSLQFAQTRNEKFLKPEDVWGAAQNYELFGNDYLGKASEEQRRAFQQTLLDQGLWREHHGTLDITDVDAAKKIWADIMSGKTKTAAKGDLSKIQPKTPEAGAGPININFQALGADPRADKARQIDQILANAPQNNQFSPIKINFKNPELTNVMPKEYKDIYG